MITDIKKKKKSPNEYYLGVYREVKTSQYGEILVDAFSCFVFFFFQMTIIILKVFYLMYYLLIPRLLKRVALYLTHPASLYLSGFRMCEWVHMTAFVAVKAGTCSSPSCGRHTLQFHSCMCECNNDFCIPSTPPVSRSP